MPREPQTRLVYSTGGEVEKTSAPERETRGEGGRIRIRLERRASGRLVTAVTGLPGASQEISALAKALKAACGAGGTVKRDVLELQGDHRERVEAELRSRGLHSKRAGG